MSCLHIKYRLFLFAVAVLAISFGHSQAAQADDSLPSWNDGPSKESIVEFVEESNNERRARFRAACRTYCCVRQ